MTGPAFDCGTTQQWRHLLTSDLPTCCDEVGYAVGRLSR